MPKSYRIRTQPGVDKNIKVEVSQDFDFLEILSLKLRQEDLYTQFCADYGVVVGRVIANGGVGIPNAHISILFLLTKLMRTTLSSQQYIHLNLLKVKTKMGLGITYYRMKMNIMVIPQQV